MIIKKKVCLLGVSAVGKTSLVRRFVHGIFSEKYHSTLGVKVDSKKLEWEGNPLELLIWDIHGDEEYKPIHLNYLKGSSGFLLVVDGTRADTLTRAEGIKQKMDDAIGVVPFVLLLNKADLTEEWEVEQSQLESLQRQGWVLIDSSAKTGQGVETAFLELCKQMISVKKVSNG